VGDTFTVTPADIAGFRTPAAVELLLTAGNNAVMFQYESLDSGAPNTGLAAQSGLTGILAIVGAALLGTGVTLLVRHSRKTQ
jgi:hypothetical protein